MSKIQYKKPKTLDMLERENKALRELVVRGLADQFCKLQAKQAIIDGLEFEADDLKTQNVKLRELVHNMYSYGASGEMELCDACVEANGDFSDCEACGEYDGACGIAKKRFEELYSNDVKALGIEVE